MTDDMQRTRVLGTLRSAGGKGAVRIENRFDTPIEDLWLAVTDPGRLARWLGDIDGDLQVGGSFRARFSATGWEGTGIVQACQPPVRLLVVTTDADGTNEGPIELTLTDDGGHTILAWEEQAPIDLLPEYGAGIQIHVEDLAAHIRGGAPCDAMERWQQLIPLYRELEIGTD